MEARTRDRPPQAEDFAKDGHPHDALGPSRQVGTLAGDEVRRAAAAAAAIALVLAGCGSSGDSDSVTVDSDWVEFCGHATALLTQSDVSHSPDPATLKATWETTGQLFAAMQASAPLEVKGAVKILADNWAARQAIFERYNYLVAEMAAAPEVSKELDELARATEVVEANTTLSETTIRECGIGE